MTNIAVLGIDLGKRHFHVHAQSATGREVMHRKYTRAQLVRLLAQTPPCLVAMEACAGAHWMAWRAQEHGHTVRLLDPRRVRAFVVGNKHDFADAHAICEAAGRPSIRSISSKTPEQLALSALHRVRDARVAERTVCTNQVHAFLLEFGYALSPRAESHEASPGAVARGRPQATAADVAERAATALRALRVSH